MGELEQMLGINLDDPEQKLASILVREDYDLLAELRKMREQRRLSQQDVADILGVTQETISAFERLGNDPRLSTIRRYAAAIDVVIRHEVEKFERTRDDVRKAFRSTSSTRTPDAQLVEGALRSHASPRAVWTLHG
jgi:transcriptional regulator with XRE-family HTH domain